MEQQPPTQQTAPHGWSRTTLMVTGVTACLLGGVSMLGWHVGAPSLVRLSPQAPPMMYNAALSLVACGVGLLGMALERHLLTLTMGAGVTVLSVMTVVEHMYRLDLGIDESLMQDVYSQATAHPGRMATTTALCLALAGGSLVLMGKPGPGRRRAHILGLLGSVVAALGLVALLGHVERLAVDLGLQYLETTALDSAIGLIVLGIGIVVWAWEAGRSTQALAVRWLPISVAVVTISFSMSQALRAQQRERLSDLLRDQAQAAAHDLSEALVRSRRELANMALRWQDRSPVQEAAWRAEASRRVSEAPGVLCVQWLTADGELRWSEPATVSPALTVGERADKETRQALGLARRQGRCVATLLESDRGAHALLLAAPVVTGDRFSGWMTETVAVQPFLDAVLGKLAALGFAVAVRQAGTEIYATSPAHRAFEKTWRRSAPLRQGRLSWSVHVWPSPGMMERWSFNLPDLTVAIGLILALFLTLTVHLAQSSAEQARELSTANRALAREIEERRHAENRLEMERNLLRTLIDTIPDFIYIKDLEHRYIVANRAFMALTNVETEQELAGRTDADMLPEDYADQAAEVERRVLAEETPVLDLEEPLTTSTGKRWLLTNRVPVLGAQGDVVGLIVASRDITERKTAAARLADSEAEMRALFASMTDAIVVIDVQGRCVRIAATRQNILPAPADEISGKSLRDIYPHDVATALVDKVRESLQAQSTLQCEFAHGSGLDERWFAATLSPMTSDRALCVIRDVTEQRRAAEALSRQSEELARSNAELQQFAYVASHDLQEPLRMVSSYMQLLEKRYAGQLDERADKYIHYAVDGAARMKRLIEDLLTYSRVGTRGKPLHPTPLVTAVTRALDNLRIRIREHGAVVTHDDLPLVLGDETQLIQLFQNLIGNAIKFHGDRPPRVHISAERAGVEENVAVGAVTPMWRIRVRDNGIGIAPEHLERIFDIFERLHTQEEYAGTGIGLAICRKIVQRHGGRLEVESAVGQGTTFTFTLADGGTVSIDASN